MTDRTAIEALIADVQNETVSSSSPHCDLPATLMLGAYAGSLDAAKALHDAVLPDWHWGLFGRTANVFKMDRPHDGQSHSAEHDNIARAWLLAILKALLSQAQEGA